MIKHPEFFIVSSGRAGSTLLQSLLNATGQIYIPPECDFIARAYPAFINKSMYTNTDYEKIVSIFRKTSQLQGWGMDQHYLVSYLRKLNPQTFADVFSVICAAYHQLERTEELLWGIKHPVLISSLDRLFTVYPNAKVVHICRDGRDVYLSYQAVHENSPVKFGPRGVIPSALYWVDGLRRVEEVQKDSIFELRYEDLLIQPEVVMHALCTFIGVDYRSTIIKNHHLFEKNRKIAPEGAMNSIHYNLKKGIDSKNTCKYLTRMSGFKIFMFEFIASPYLKNKNYQLKYLFINTKLFNPIRSMLYFWARLLNTWRYAQRDQKACRIVSHNSPWWLKLLPN